MNALVSLYRLKQAGLSFSSAPVSSQAYSAAVETQLYILNNLPYGTLLQLLADEDEQKLGAIVSRLKKGTPLYSFSVLAYNLSKAKTDFDLLTSPENIPVYEKMISVSKMCGSALPPYINVLKKIAGNKQYSMYSENQEVGFFFDEYGRCKESFSADDFLRQFRKILKYPTQRLFMQFIHNGIFSLIKTTLKEHASKIANKQALIFYVYGLHYYKRGISNEDEHFLLEHIGFCVDYLSRHSEIEFHPVKNAPLLPQLDGEEDAIAYFFSHNKETVHSLDRFIGLLKDVCPSSESNEFCEFLRTNLHKAKKIRFGDTKNDFAKTMMRTICQKAKSENVQLYTDICSLMPQVYICSRYPNIWRHNDELFYTFSDINSIEKLHALEKGNQNPKVPESHTRIELEVLEKDENGYALLWNWHEIPASMGTASKRIVCIPEYGKRNSRSFGTYAEAGDYLGLKEHELKEYIKTGRPYKGYKIRFDTPAGV